MAVNVNTTSSASNLDPSENLTPFFNLNVNVEPSSLTVGCSVASSGCS